MKKSSKIIKFTKQLVFPETVLSSTSLIEQVSLNTLFLVTAIEGLLSIFFNIFELNDYLLASFTTAIFIGFSFLYYLSRYKNYRNFWFNIILIIILFDFFYFLNGGIVGSVQYIYLITFIILVIAATYRQQKSLFIVFFTNILMLYTVEYMWGEQLIHPYRSIQDQIFDLMFVFILVFLLMFYTIRFFKMVFETERQKVEEQNKIIEEQNNELKLKAEELQLANEKRTNAFVNLAHETKTPLTLINNYLEEYILQRGLSKELRVIKSSVDKLTKDVIDFFDLERINKGVDIYNHHQNTNFSNVLNEYILLFTQYANTKRITIEASVEADICVQAAPEAIQRLLCNLIENAIKYTNINGKIIISLKSEGGSICFSVKDNGMGINPELHKNIFEPYYQINSKKANFQGMGLGLSIVKKIIDGLHGKILIHSNPEEAPGAEFVVQLPQHFPSSDEIVPEFKHTNTYIGIEHLSIQDKAFDGNKYTIMIVEDNIPLMNYIVEKLQEKYNVFFALCGWEALEKLKTIEHLDLLVSDIMMDNGNGLDLYKDISSQVKFKHIPVIFITAKATAEDKLHGLALGAIDYIFKPFLISELTVKIDSILNNMSEQRKAIVHQAYNSLMNNRHSSQPLTTSNTFTDGFEEQCKAYLITNREKDVINLIKKGQTYKQIADNLCISDKTVAKHLQNVFEKVNVTNKLELLNKLGTSPEHT